MISPDSPNRTYHRIAEYAGFEREEFFEEHYAIAQAVAGVIRISEPEETMSSIYNLVSSELGPDAPEIEALAVSALTATARSRVLRRPLARNQRDFREEKKGIFHHLTLGSIRQRRALMREQLHIMELQRGCLEAEDAYIKEALPATEQ